MSAKHKAVHHGRLLFHIAAATLCGSLLMLIILVLGSWLLLHSETGEVGMSVCIYTAVFMGSMLASLMNHKNLRGIVSRILLTSSFFILMLSLLSIALSGVAVSSVPDYKIAVSAVLGSSAGLVTNLVKSNKSYTNKTNRKHWIT